MANSIYDITERYSNILDLCENPDVPREAIEEALNEIEGEFTTKVENIVAFIKTLENSNVAIKTEVDRLSARKKTNENKIGYLKGYLMDGLRAIDKTKVETRFNTVTLSKTPPSVNVLAEDLIPERFIKTEIVKSVDKKSILSDLKLGVEIEGVELKQGTSIRIK